MIKSQKIEKKLQKLKKSLSQNLLNDKNIRNKIIKYCNIVDKKIIEIGPGTGFLTEGIIGKKPKKLILIEKDILMYSNLKNKYKNFKNIEIHNNDALNFDFKNYTNYNIISNLPYNVSTKLILSFLKNNKNFNELVLMIQKDVAKKFDYQQEKMNKYKFLINLFGDYKICFDVSPNAFYPKPKVKSSVIKIKLNKSSHDWKKLNNFVKVLFKSRRKIISNLIKTNNNDLISRKRVEELNFDELLKIYQFF